MTTGKLLATAGILLALVSLSFLHAAAQSYTVTDLGTLGGQYSGALALNDSGQVVGFSDTKSSGQHAFFWSSTDGMLDLGSVNEFSSDSAYAINNSGQVVGRAGSLAFLWTKDGGMQDLGNLGGNSAAAYGINNLGQVVGFSVLSDNRTSHAFLWSASIGMQDLGTLGGINSVAYAVNDSSQVVGDSLLSDNVTRHAFLWTAATGMQDLGTLGGAWSSAVSINSYGKIVGWSYSASDPATAVIWDPIHGFQPLTGSRPTSSATGINSIGQVVGFWTTGQSESGFLWTKATHLRNLNALISPRNNRVVAAYGVNKSGQIAAGGTSHALLLTP